MKSALNIHWKDWCWSWNFNTLATWCEELTHLKRPWCWERLKVGGEGDDKGWDGWMASLTQWTWVWINSGAGNGQGGLACCSPWGCKESDMTKWLNWTELELILSMGVWSVCRLHSNIAAFYARHLTFLGFCWNKGRTVLTTFQSLFTLWMVSSDE